MCRWIAFSILLFASSVRAESFHAFGARKVQIQNRSRALLLLFDEECRAGRSFESSLPFLKLKHKTYSRLKYAAVHAETAKALTNDQMQTLEKTPCLIGVTNDQPVRISAAASDPRLNSQVFRAPIEHDVAERIFFHPFFGISQPAIVAVVDTGAELDHPDLATRLWSSPTDGNGYDFVNQDTDPSDDNGHGTHVAGLIGAQRLNGVGGRGIMGDLSQLMILKAEGIDGNGRISDVVTAMNWAVDHGAQVINLSLTSATANPAMETAIQYALAHNVVLVAASGNDGELLTASTPLIPISYASSYQGLIGVGSFDALTLQRSSFSNFSPTLVEMAAPGSASGQGIFSTYLSGTYLGMEGTSMAAPQVSGAAALAISFLKSQNANFTAADIENDIEASSVQDPALSGQFASGRRLDLRRLGLLLMHSTYLDSSGGFNDP